MVSQYVLIGIVAGVFILGIGVGYGVFFNQLPSGDMMTQNQLLQQMMMQNPHHRQQMIDQMLEDPQQMRQWMTSTQHAKEMSEVMKEDHDFMMEMMQVMIEDPSLRLQMIGHMTENQEAMQQMMNMMGNNMMMGDMMMGNNMMGSGMMNQGMMSSQSSQTIPSNEEPQTRTFQISMEEVEFYAEVENEGGEEAIAFVELHRWEPNTIIVNQGDTVVLEITNPRKHAHTLSIPAFDVNTKILEPREGSDTLTFVADTPGVFTFYCGLPYNPDKLYCDPDHNMMTGTLIVLE